eukprot:728561-Prymnesium_polylepis.1
MKPLCPPLCPVAVRPLALPHVPTETNVRKRLSDTVIYGLTSNRKQSNNRTLRYHAPCRMRHVRSQVWPRAHHASSFSSIRATVEAGSQSSEPSRWLASSFFHFQPRASSAGRSPRRGSDSAVSASHGPSWWALMIRPPRHRRRSSRRGWAGLQGQDRSCAVAHPADSRG